MYRLILVDDETEICQGLREVVPFEALGFTVVGEASNGVEALQLCEALAPDLIITDIRMPLMDGLTLCRRVRPILPTAQFIILSGYDDFEYARQAIEVKTLGYLLKPISATEFVEMLKQTKITLDEEFARRRNVQLLQEHFRESLPLLKDMLLSSLMAGNLPPPEAQAKAEKYGMNLEAEAYMLALFKMDEAHSRDGLGEEQLRLFAVRNILCEALEERRQGYRTYVFMYNNMLEVLFLLSSGEEALFAQVVSHLDEARKTIAHFLDIPLFIGVSGLCEGIKALPGAARQALTAVDQCALSQKAQVLCITDIAPRSGNTLPPDEFALRQLVNSIKAGDETQAQASLQSLMNVCRGAGASPRAYQAYLLELLIALARIIPELSLPDEGLSESVDRTMQEYFHTCPSLEEAHARLWQLSLELIAAVQNHRRSSSLRLASEAEQYLQQNFAQEDLSLEKLCLHLHISPSYFSSLFKKETKKTFHQYVTELRMDRALTLLSSTTLKTAQIAQQVGLPDPSYFSYCFKKHFGFPPSQARKGKSPAS